MAALLGFFDCLCASESEHHTNTDNNNSARQTDHHSGVVETATSAPQGRITGLSYVSVAPASALGAGTTVNVSDPQRPILVVGSAVQTSVAVVIGSEQSPSSRPEGVVECWRKAYHDLVSRVALTPEPRRSGMLFCCTEVSISLDTTMQACIALLNGLLGHLFADDSVDVRPLLVRERELLLDLAVCQLLRRAIKAYPTLLTSTSQMKYSPPVS